MSAAHDNVIPLHARITARPADPLLSEELIYCSQVAIGLDGLEDGSAVVFRRVGDKVGLIPTPDVGTAVTILLMLHREIRLSQKAGDLTGFDGFHVDAVEEELDDIFRHYGPHLRIMQENSMAPFDQAFDRDEHFERVVDGREIVPEI